MLRLSEMGERTHISDLLRQAREQRGLTVEGAAAETGIPERYIRLLEGAQVQVGVADEFYLIPFFRRYAAFVGLDVVQVLPEFLAQVQQTPNERPAPPVAITYRRSRARIWKPLTAALAASLAALLLLRHRHDNDTTPQVREIEPPVTVADVDSVGDGGGFSEPALAGAAAEGEPAAGAANAAPPDDVAAGEAMPSEAPVGAPEHRELRIVASEPTWIAIGLDDEPTREFLLQPGDTRTWTARGTFTLKIGNAGGISLALDGHELPALGTSGQVVRLQLPQPPGGPRDG